MFHTLVDPTIGTSVARFYGFLKGGDCDLRPYGLAIEHLSTGTRRQQTQEPPLDFVTLRPDASRAPRFSFKASSEQTPTPKAVASQVKVVRCSSGTTTTTASCDTIEEVIWDSGWIVGGRRNGLEITHAKPFVEKWVPMELLHWTARFGISAGNSSTTNNTTATTEEILPCPWSDMYEPFLVGPSDEQWSQSEWMCGHQDDHGGPRVESDCDYYDTHGKMAAPLFRTEFELPSSVAATIKSARLFVTGLGHYEAWMNGVHINQHRYLDPAPSTYTKRIYYNSFDVRHAIEVNTRQQSFGFLVGNGWWNPLPMKFWGGRNLRDAMAVGSPRVRCILQIEFKEEETAKPLVIYSSSSSGEWMTADSGLLRNDLYLGNVVDLNRNDWLSGWSIVGFNSPLIHWTEVQGCPSDPSLPPFPEPQPIPPIRSRPPHILRPKSITTIDDEIVMDMGKNTAAAVHVEIIVPNNWVCSQQQIELKFGELLFPNGTVNVYTSVAGQIKSQDCCGPCAPSLAYQSLVLRTTKSANYTTQFSWSAFRYVQISSLPPGWEIKVEARPIMTNLQWTTSFESSNVLLNDIFEMCRNTHASNMMGIQSDCPHRERFGYTGDALATLPVSLAFFDGASFYEKRLYDVLDSLRPNGGVTETAPFVGIASNGLGDESGPIGWQSFFPQVQIYLDQYYGSVRALDDARNDTQQWIRFIMNHTAEVENGLGDWMATDKVPVAISGRIFLIEALRAWAVLTDSKQEQQAALTQLDDELDAFKRRFVKENGDIVWEGSHPTQSGQAMAIFFNLIQSPSLQALVEESLVHTVENAQRHLTTGMFGILPLFESLSAINQTALAWDILMQKDFPSYGYMLENNATTLWESWFFSDNTFSHNHPMFSGVISWILSHIGGITVAKDAIGADRLIMAPRPPDGSGLTYTEMSLETARGLAKCHWKCTAGGTMYLSIHCPANTICLVVLPDGSSPFKVGGGKFTYYNVSAAACEVDDIMATL